MIDVLRIAHLRIAPQEGNLEVGNCEGILYMSCALNLYAHSSEFLDAIASSSSWCCQ